MKLKGNWETREVWLNSVLLAPELSQKVYNHSPDGFNWGYGGSGPAQLALAILLEVVDQETALKNYQDFKFDIIAKLPESNFEVNIDVISWINNRK